VGYSQDRLDQVVAALFPQYSRSRLQSWIKSGQLLVDGVAWRPRDKVSGGELVEIDAVASTISDEAEDIPLDIVFEDESILVINKPSGLVVHPGAGNRKGTLLNALLHFCPDLNEVPRAGIVHRLDKETTGLMVVAKTIESQTSLVQQLQSREVKRLYHAVVYGLPPKQGIVDAPIGRHRLQRTRMAIREQGKEAITRFRLLGAYKSHSHMEFSLETGRTHQIRVHMQHLGYPLVGDPAYGGQFRTPRKGGEELGAVLKEFPRQALHAKALSFLHPATLDQVTFENDLPEDLRLLLTALEKDMSILDD
jgi:23S rRNA pseudouridine1911/1915/1917 synthase